MAKASQKKQKKNNMSDSTTKTSTNISTSDEFVKISTTKGKRSRRSMPRESASQRSSVYRGVTRHRWTGRYEAHLWDKDGWSDTQKKKKGKQVYLGAYDDEAAAARAYDLAALKYWGKETILNFVVSTYDNELKEMEALSREEYIGSLRRKSSGFSRGVSKYRGVARHHHNGRWEARIGRVLGNKYLYLGTYATQEEAATAYDMAAIEYRGLNAVTNFDLSRYIDLPKPNHNSCDDQLSPNNNVEYATKSMETSASSTTTSSSTPTFFELTFEEGHDQLEEHDISIDEVMLWCEPPSADCSSTLLDFDEYMSKSMPICDTTNHNLCPYVEGQGPSSSNDIGSNEDGFFSDLSSFLCDFDAVDEQFVT